MEYLCSIYLFFSKYFERIIHLFCLQYGGFLSPRQSSWTVQFIWPLQHAVRERHKRLRECRLHPIRRYIDWLRWELRHVKTTSLFITHSYHFNNQGVKDFLDMSKFKAQYYFYETHMNLWSPYMFYCWIVLLN